jgi:hypothetical protein
MEIDDEYIPGIRVAEMAATLYGHFSKHFPTSVEQEIAGSANSHWQRTLTCGDPDCGKTHTYRSGDLRLYEE